MPARHESGGCRYLAAQRAQVLKLGLGRAQKAQQHRRVELVQRDAAHDVTVELLGRIHRQARQAGATVSGAFGVPSCQRVAYRGRENANVARSHERLQDVRVQVEHVVVCVGEAPALADAP